MNELAIKLFELSKWIAERGGADEHRTAVLAQLTFANHIFVGINTECEKGNGLCGEVLLRTLFEVLTSMVILAKHPEKLTDFADHGRMTELRMMRVSETTPLSIRLERLIEATEPEFQRLRSKFNERPWHGLGTNESFAEAEFGADAYSLYYGRAWAISHGQPYVTVRGGQVGARPAAWKHLSVGAQNMAMLLLLMSISVLNREFHLGADSEIPRFHQQLDAHVKQYMNQVLEMTDTASKRP